MPIEEYGLPHIKSISLVDKVRVVNALTGFSRINPAMNKDDVGFVSVKRPETRWYPAYEVRGEGIFIEFNQQDIDKWVEENPEVARRASHLMITMLIPLSGKIILDISLLNLLCFIPYPIF